MHSHAERGDDQSRSRASRLKPVPLTARVAFGGTSSRRETAFAFAFAFASACDPLLIFIHSQSIHCQSRLGCRLNAGFAQWAERHGCRESRPPPWMADGGGPTEQDRSEGIPTKEGLNQEQKPLVTWGFIK
jgi:hypothetical protein